jgi:hypothetical protein
MNTPAPPTFITATQSPDELEIYKSYALWSAYQSQFGFYSSLPAYHQLSTTPVLIRSPSSLSSSSDSTTEQIQHFNRESPSTMRDFKLICEHCGSVYTSRKRLQNHYEKCVVLHPHLDELIGCKVCKRTFKTNTGYTNHMMRFHSEVVESQKVIEIEDDASMEVEQSKERSIFHSIDMLARSDSFGGKK